jgi:hypothetical protein
MAVIPADVRLDGVSSMQSGGDVDQTVVGESK